MKRSLLSWLFLQKRNTIAIRHFSSELRIPSLEIFQRAVKYNSKTAIIDSNGKYSYADLLKDSEKLANQISNREDLKDKRIAVLTQNSYEYVKAQWAVWRSGTTHPPSELEYYIKDSDASLAICDSSFENILKPLSLKLNIPCIRVDVSKPAGSSSSFSNSTLKIETSVKTYSIDPQTPAMIIYTSGTTGKPKGVVTTHANIQSQILTMVDPWGWSFNDHILHVLPLHHVHGVVNGLATPLWIGAVCEFLPKFDAKQVWEKFMKKDSTLNFFTAVPTIYARLTSYYEQMDADFQRSALESCKKIRLMISGSMALPESVFKRWKEISGHTLLERYGMTEIGMALSNPYKGERIAGTVGYPLPTVQVRIVDEVSGKTLPEGNPGELRIKGPSIFKEYWRRPDATKETFDEEGWFKTGDIAVNNGGRFKILGRASVDIIKSGGYKISALDIERELLEHPDIAEIAVVGVADEAMGQKIGAIVVTKDNRNLSLDDLKNWAKDRLAPYKIPKLLLVVNSMPRNAMGKVNKKDLVKLFAGK